MCPVAVPEVFPSDERQGGIMVDEFESCYKASVSTAIEAPMSFITGSHVAIETLNIKDVTAR